MKTKTLAGFQICISVPLSQILKIIFCYIATKYSESSSFESKFSSKSKIDLHNETSPDDKFRNVRETKLQKFEQKAFHLNILNQFLRWRSYQIYAIMS